MAEILGFLAGVGMIALVAALVVLFLGQMGWMRRDAALLLGRSAVMTVSVGLLYLGLALVFDLSVYGEFEDEFSLDAIFRGPYMRAMLSALEEPTGVGPLSMVFAWLCFLLGKLLFGQYAFCGICLAWGITAASLFLVQLRMRKIAGDQTARDGAFLLLCLPGSVFFLLPGCAPLCLLLCAIIFYLVGKRIPAWKLTSSPVSFGWVLSICSVLSAAVTICAAVGRLG